MSNKNNKLSLSSNIKKILKLQLVVHNKEKNNLMITSTHKRDLLVHIFKSSQSFTNPVQSHFTICHYPRMPEIDNPGIELGPIARLAVGIEKDEPAGLLIEIKYSLWQCF